MMPRGVILSAFQNNTIRFTGNKSTKVLKPVIFQKITGFKINVIILISYSIASIILLTIVDNPCLYIVDTRLIQMSENICTDGYTGVTLKYQVSEKKVTLK